MAPKKRARGDGASSSCSSKSIIKERTELVTSLKFVAERGMAWEEDDQTRMYRRLIEHYEWENFVAEPIAPVIAFVREFYTALPDCENGESKVKKTRVVFSPEIINELYQTPNIPEKEDNYFQWSEHGVFNKGMNAHILSQGCDTVYRAASNTLLDKSITVEAKIWNMFCHHRLLPSKNYTELTVDYQRILFTILTGFDVNVGRLIYKQIQGFKKALGEGTLGVKATLPFPSLVTMLCVRAGIAIPASAHREEMPSAINLSTLGRLFEPAGYQWAGSSHTFFHRHWADMAKEGWVHPQIPNIVEEVAVVRAGRHQPRFDVDPSVFFDDPRWTTFQERTTTFQHQQMVAQQQQLDYQSYQHQLFVDQAQRIHDSEQRQLTNIRRQDQWHLELMMNNLRLNPDSHPYPSYEPCPEFVPPPPYQYQPRRDDDAPME